MVLDPMMKMQSGIFDLGDRVCHCPTPESGGKTCHRGGVSETGAVVYVVRSKPHPAEFLEQVVLFVGAFR